MAYGAKVMVEGWDNSGLLFLNMGGVEYTYRIHQHRLMYWKKYIEEGGWNGLNALKPTKDWLWYGNHATGIVVDNPNLVR